MNTYKIQNLTFTYKKNCFKLSMESDKIKDDFDEVCKKFNLKELEKIVKMQYVKNVKVFQDVAKTGEGMTELELLGLIEDKDMDLFSEMAMSNSDYQTALDSAKRTYLSNPDNVKKLFETVLDGDTSKIKYDVEGAEFGKLIKVVKQVFEDFFLQYPSLTKGLITG